VHGGDGPTSNETGWTCPSFFRKHNAFPRSVSIKLSHRRSHYGNAAAASSAYLVPSSELSHSHDDSLEILKKIGQIASIVGWLSYNILLHPLRNYPGPLLWRASPIPRILSRWRGTTVFDAHRLHEQYGPIVRLSPWELSYTSSHAWKGRHDSARRCIAWY
jgi:hypothetical protein